MYTTRPWQNGGVIITTALKSTASLKTVMLAIGEPDASRRRGPMTPIRTRLLNLSRLACRRVTIAKWIPQLRLHAGQPDIVAAIKREKQLTHWQRKWKIRLISEENPLWRDLYCDIAGL